MQIYYKKIGRQIKKEETNAVSLDVEKQRKR